MLVLLTSTPMSVVAEERKKEKEKETSEFELGMREMAKVAFNLAENMGLSDKSLNFMQETLDNALSNPFVLDVIVKWAIYPILRTMLIELVKQPQFRVFMKSTVSYFELGIDGMENFVSNLAQYTGVDESYFQEGAKDFMQDTLNQAFSSSNLDTIVRWTKDPRVRAMFDELAMDPQFKDLMKSIKEDLKSRPD